MKALMISIWLAAGMGLIMSCGPEYPIIPEDATGDGSNFNASFSVCFTQGRDLRLSLAPPFPGGHTLYGIGTDMRLGPIEVQMQLCGDGRDSDNPVCGWYYAVGSIITGNGDELYFEIPHGWIRDIDVNDAFVAPNEHENRLSFVGGTGRFVGATGAASIDAWADLDGRPWKADFNAKGMLYLAP